MVRKGPAYPGIGDWVALAVTGALSLFLLFSGTGSRIQAARVLRGSILYPFRLVILQACRPDDREGQIMGLRQRLALSRLDEAVWRESIRENERLRDLFDFAKREERALMPSQILGRTMDRFGEVLTLARGERDGVCEGQAVLGIEGLVGVVTAADGGECWVKTLRHGALPVSGMLQDSRYVGTVRWSPARRLLRLEGIPLQSEVGVGEQVITSGYGQVFPKGIPVGRVVSVMDDSTGLVKRILVRPFVDLDRAEEFFLLEPEATMGG